MITLLLWFGVGSLVGVAAIYCLQFLFELLWAFIELFTD